MNSVRRGLPQAHRNFNINIDQLDLIKSNVVVVSDLEAGLQAYDLKSKTKIKTLMVGPNIVGNPYTHDAFISWPHIDAFLSPSLWPAQTMVRLLPTLEGRIRIWFAGIDENYWRPELAFAQKNNKAVLIYRKTHPELCDAVEKILREHGFTVSTVSYGSYNHDEFKNKLSRCCFAVFISSSESQGIALAEAWSMDVPTLVWNPGQSVQYEGIEWNNVTSCAYLNPWVGKDWKTVEDLESLLKNFEIDATPYHPRRWVLLHMTDKISAEVLIHFIREMNKVKAEQDLQTVSNLLL